MTEKQGEGPYDPGSIRTVHSLDGPGVPESGLPFHAGSIYYPLKG